MPKRACCYLTYGSEIEIELSDIEARIETVVDTTVEDTEDPRGECLRRDSCAGTERGIMSHSHASDGRRCRSCRRRCCHCCCCCCCCKAQHPRRLTFPRVCNAWRIAHARGSLWMLTLLSRSTLVCSVYRRNKILKRDICAVTWEHRYIRRNSTVTWIFDATRSTFNPFRCSSYRRFEKKKNKHFWILSFSVISRRPTAFVEGRR